VRTARIPGEGLFRFALPIRGTFCGFRGVFHWSGLCRGPAQRAAQVPPSRPVRPVPSFFTGIADARSKLAGATSIKDKAEADAALTAGLGRLLAIAENYPELKANENFIRLQDELSGTENRIAVSRKRYNDGVKRYNMSIRQFPGSFFAGSLGLTTRDYFEPPQGHDAVVKAPTVEF
jgi:hypothetical protein